MSYIKTLEDAVEASTNKIAKLEKEIEFTNLLRVNKLVYRYYIQLWADNPHSIKYEFFQTYLLKTEYSGIVSAFLKVQNFDTLYTYARRWFPIRNFRQMKAKECTSIVVGSSASTPYKAICSFNILFKRVGKNLIGVEYQDYREIDNLRGWAK